MLLRKSSLFLYSIQKFLKVALLTIHIFKSRSLKSSLNCMTYTRQLEIISGCLAPTIILYTQYILSTYLFMYVIIVRITYTVTI